MAIEKPDLHPIDWLWDAVCIIGGGSAWPDGNEDHLRELAQAWQDLGTELNGLLNNSDTVAMQIAQAWGGDAGEAFNQYWTALAVGPQNGLPQVADIALNYSAAADNAAMEIEYAKLVLGITLIVTVITIVICQILAAFTFGGSEAAAAGAVTAARTVAGRVLQRLISFLGKEFVKKYIRKFIIHEIQQVVLSVGTDWLAQEIQIAEGHRKELDTHSLMNSLVSGLVTGALTFPLNFVHLPIKSRLPRVAANAAVHGAANALIMPASMMLTTGFMTGDWSWKNITQGINLQSFINGAAMGGGMGGIGAIRSPKQGAHGAAPHVDGEAGRPGETNRGGENGTRGLGDTSVGDPGLDTNVRDSGVTGDGGATGDGGTANGNRPGADVTGSDYTPGDGQSLAPTSDNPAGGSVAAPVDSNAHGDSGAGQNAHGGGDPVTQRGGDPVVQHAADSGNGASGGDGGARAGETRAGETQAGGAQAGGTQAGETHAGSSAGAHAGETGARAGADGGASGPGADRAAAGADRAAAGGERAATHAGGPVAEHPGAVVGVDRPAGADGARTTDAVGRGADGTGRAADAVRGAEGTGRGAEGTGRGAEGTGRGAEGAGRGAEGTGRGAEGTGRGSEGAGRGSEGAGRGSDGAGRGNEGARAGDSGRASDGARSGEKAGERGGGGARTTDGGRTTEQNRTNGSFRAPERAGEVGARPGEHVPVGEHGRPGESGAQPGEHVRAGETSGRPGEHVQVGEARPGEHGARPGEDGARPGENGARPGDNGARPGENGARPGEHQPVHAGEQGRGSEHAPVRDGTERSDGAGRHRAEEPAAVFVPLPRLDDMPVRIGGSEPGAGSPRPVSMHEGGGRGTETLPGREHGPGDRGSGPGDRGEGPRGGRDEPPPGGGGEEPPPPGDRPNGGEEPASKLSTTETAGGTRGYEGPPRHFEGDPGSREGRAAVDDSARDLADAVRDQMNSENLGKKNRVRVAGALLTPEDPTISSHTSTRPMKHDNGTATDVRVHPEAQRVLDDIKAAAEHDPGKRIGQNHGKCAEVVLVSDKLYELERQWHEAGEPGDFGTYAREQLRDGVVATHWIGEGGRQEHGDYAPPCASCEPFVQDFGLHSIDPHEGAASHGPTTGPHEPTGGRPGEHDPGSVPGEHGPGEGVRPPETLGGITDRPLSEARTNEYNDPTPHEVRELDEAFPRDEHGRPLTQPDVRVGDWAHNANDGGHTEPGRNNNCPEVAMAVLANHYGEPTVAGALRDPHAAGERGAADRISRWTGGEWEMHGSDHRGFDGIDRQLRETGPGSGAVVVVKWGDTGEGHAFNALNIHGDIVWVDMQHNVVSDHGPMYHDNVAGVWSITLDAHGEPLHPIQHTTGMGDGPAHAGGAGPVDRYQPHELSAEHVIGEEIQVKLQLGDDGKLHMEGDPKDTSRTIKGNLQRGGSFVKDWHTAIRNDMVAMAHQGEPVPHELTHDPARPENPVEQVREASRDYHDARERAYDAFNEKRDDIISRYEEETGADFSDFGPKDLKPGTKEFETALDTLKQDRVGSRFAAELRDAAGVFNKDMHPVRMASNAVGVHAGLGVAFHEAMHNNLPTPHTQVNPEHVFLSGDPVSAKNHELDIIALRYDGSGDAPAHYNRLDIWEAKGNSGTLGGHEIPEFGGKRAQQGSGPYLKWMLEHDPTMLRLYAEHPTLLADIQTGKVTVAYHKVTTECLDPVRDGAGRLVRDPQTGRPQLVDGSSRTHVREFGLDGVDRGGHERNSFDPSKINPDPQKIHDAGVRAAEEAAAARGEHVPERLSGYDPERVYDVRTTQGGRVWHAELGLGEFGAATPHEVEARVHRLLEGAADPRTWVDGAPPRIVVHAPHGIDAATARLIEHTRVEFTPPDPGHPVAPPRITVDGPRLHGEPITLPETTVANDRANRVPYFGTDPSAPPQVPVRVVDGRLYDTGGLPLHGEYIYAVDPRTQELHAHPFMADNTRHSSLLAGGPVDAAGTLRIEHGRILGVDNASGHYTPVADHVARARDALVHLGADLTRAEFRADVGPEPTEHSRARGEQAFDRAIAELNRPGEIDGVAGVSRDTSYVEMSRAERPAVLRVELTDGRVIEVDGAGVRDFLQAARHDGPDAEGFRFPAEREGTATDADLAFQGADQLRDRIQGELDRLAAPPREPVAEPRPPARPDHVLTELDRLLAERTGQETLHAPGRDGEPVLPPRDTDRAIATLRNVSDERIAALVERAGVAGEAAARMATELAARRDAVLERNFRPPAPEAVYAMARDARGLLGRNPSPREVYEALREASIRNTETYAHGMTVREAARAVDRLMPDGNRHETFERTIARFLDSPEGRAHHEAITELDLATNHAPHFDPEGSPLREPSPEVVERQSAQHAAGWSTQQRAALERYANGRSSADQYLRTGDAQKRSVARAEAYRIQSAMRESPTAMRLTGELFWRDLGLRGAVDLPRLVHGEITLDGFTRVMPEEHLRSSGDVRIVVDAPAGTPMAWIGGAHDYAEGHALLPAGARLHVTELRQTGFDRFELRLRYTGFEDPPTIDGRLLADGGPRPGDLHDAGQIGVPAPAGEPMSAGHAYAVAREAGIDLRGVEIRVAEDPALARYMREQGVLAIVPPEEGGRVVVLGPDAFADRDTLATTLREHGGGAGDPHHGGEPVRLDRPGSDGLGVPDGGHHRAGDEAGRRYGEPRDGAGHRAGEPAGPGAGVGHSAAGAHDAEPGGRGGDAEGGGAPGGGVPLPRDPGPGDGGVGHDLGGLAGDEPGGGYRAGDILSILGGEPAAGFPGDHPGAGGADPAGGPHDHALGGGAAPDHADPNLTAHRLVQERIAPHSPELASVVEKLLDDPHALNVTNSLRNPLLRDLVLRHIEELARGDALARYGGDLHQFLQEHPGRGPLYAKVPDWVNKVVVDGAEQSRMGRYVADLKASDPALGVGADPTPAEMGLVREYADRLTGELKPEVDRVLGEIAQRIRETTDGPVDYNSRAKDAEGLIDKVGRMSRGRENAPGRPWYRVGDIIDAVGARITVPDTSSLWKTLQAVVDEFGVGDGGRIVEVDNMYASPKSKSPEYRVIPLCIGIEVNGHKYAFELQLTTLRASIAADIEHNSLYKPYVSLSAADAQAVREAFEEAAALDQLEDSS
ncbi:toxin glutamine deamidase domain-containing protein [Dactylosporangium sp. CA-139114]|uniref:WXG100-like domain-containing protein n=1 Tax=Dactylosporangium sp. CA-139114 TaxID=3239931 RepID=UPI003D98B16C